MTDTVRRPGRPHTSRPASGRPAARRGIVYGILTVAVGDNGLPIPGRIVLGYIGQSRQQVEAREGQHRVDQPWSDLIVGGAFIIESGVWTDAELNEYEQWYIQHGAVLVSGQAPQRPMYNIDWNRGNPDRILPWTAVEHRQRREPGWVPPPKGARIPQQRGPQRPATAKPARSRSRLNRWWQRRRWTIAAWSSLWTALTAASWWVGADTWSGWAEPRNAAVAGTALTGLAAWRLHRPKRRRTRRGRGRR